MRTFPKSLAAFRKIINERGSRLREIAFDDLRQMTAVPVETVTVGSHSAKIAVIVEMRQNDRLRVVIQGFLKASFLPGDHIALDGFYKLPDQTVTAMPREEFYDFG